MITVTTANQKTCRIKVTVRQAPKKVTIGAKNRNTEKRKNHPAQGETSVRKCRIRHPIQQQQEKNCHGGCKGKRESHPERKYSDHCETLQWKESKTETYSQVNVLMKLD